MRLIFVTYDFNRNSIWEEHERRNTPLTQLFLFIQTLKKFAKIQTMSFFLTKLFLS